MKDRNEAVKIRVFCDSFTPVKQMNFLFNLTLFTKTAIVCKSPKFEGKLNKELTVTH